ncbi:MAG: hypothetical protein U0354_20110 [Candidatus Sericytochromatia bacterium]
MTISFKKVGALLSSFLLILSCQPTIINTVPKETPKNQVLNNKTFTKKSLDCYIDYIPRSGATIVSNSGGLVVADPHITLANGKLAYDALYVSYGPDAVPLNVEFNVGRLKDGETTAVSGIGRQVYAFGSIGDFSFGGKLWEIPLSGAVTLKDGKLNLKFSGSVANCTTGRAELGICGQNGSAQEPLGGSIEAEISYNGCLSLDVSRDLVSFNPDNDSEFNNVDLNVNASNFVNSRLIANNYTFIKEGKGNYSENLNKDNTHGIPDGNNLIMVHGGDHQSDTKPLKVDSTPPEVVDINIDDSSEPIKIKVKVKDPEINGFSSGIDKDETKIESSLGGSSTCDGETITYTLPMGSKINQLRNSISNGKISINVFDKVKNKYKEPIYSLKSSHKIIEENDNSFNIKTHLIRDPDGNNASHLFFPKENKNGCKFKYKVINIFEPENKYIRLTPNNVQLFTVNYKIEKKQLSLFSSNEEVYSKDYIITMADDNLRISGNKIYHIFYWDGVIGKDNNGKDILIDPNEYILFSSRANVKINEHPYIGVMFPWNDQKLEFDVIDGAVGNGPYSILDDTDPNKNLRKKGMGFYDNQRALIYLKNKSINQSSIENVIRDWNDNKYQDKNGNGLNPNKIPLTKAQEARLLSNDSKKRGAPQIILMPTGNKILSEILKIDKTFSKSLENMPINFPYQEEAELDHIIAENVASECCERQGTNHFSNARLIGIDENRYKSNECIKYLNN